MATSSELPDTDAGLVCEGSILPRQLQEKTTHRGRFLTLATHVAPQFYFMTSGVLTLSFPSRTLKRKAERSDSIRSMGLEKDHEFNVRWLRAARRVLKPDGSLWVSGTHHIIFSLGFALQRLGFKIINQIVWQKPDPVPNALHTAFTH
jgi:DNA modification methylase